MKRVLVGHRGVGKTALLKRHKTYFPEVEHFDLDQKIELSTQRKIVDIFSADGEAEFRRLEKEIFYELSQLKDFVIAVGGGFPVDQIPEDIEVVYVSRVTDKDGRIFLNRPKINSNLGDLEDSLKLYNARQEKFLVRANFVYHMPEGIDGPDEKEKIIFLNEKIELNNNSIYLTVVKHNSWEMRFPNLELRTDLLTIDQIIQIAQKFAEKNIIISYRSQQPLSSYRRNHVMYDWALELGEPSASFLSQKNIISIHDGSLSEGIKKLSLYHGQHLKLCPVIESWSELIEGYRWQQQDPETRSFLPRSASGGDYRWFRLLAMGKQKINFIQGAKPIADQPFLYEVLNLKQNVNNFGAVIGHPVHHSRTPYEQGKSVSLPVLSISIKEDDFERAMKFLEELGLKFAAVTSPLKIRTGHYNSLKLKDKKWLGTTTDHFGFKKLIEQIPTDLKHQVALWGGSGVISALKNEISDLQCYSARTGAAKEAFNQINPQVVIWGAPRLKDVRFPDQIYPQWKPQWVIDLNYTDNSMGIEYAKRNNIKYISGLEMFLEQARHQREFWKDVL